MVDRDELRRTAILVGLLILILPLLMMSLMWSMMGRMMGPMGGSAFPGILPLLLALGIGYAGYRFVTSAPKQDDVSTEDTSDPVERLQKQYTGGEITEAEFERRLEYYLADDSPPKSVDKSHVDATDPSATKFER